jgi:hypothetical protein
LPTATLKEGKKEGKKHKRKRSQRKTRGTRIDREESERKERRQEKVTGARKKGNEISNVAHRDTEGRIEGKNHKEKQKQEKGRGSRIDREESEIKERMKGKVEQRCPQRH